MSADVARGVDLPHDTSRPHAMPYMMQQYALPIHQASDYRDGSVNFGEHAPRPENALRRKTPNGTLNAGYDGADSNLNPHKHQVMPRMQNFEPLAPQQPAQAGNKRTFMQHQQQLHNAPRDGWANGGGLGWAATPSSFPVMDSMLMQMPVHQYQNIQQYYNQSIPSVLQPSLQYIGPTASGVQGAGPYGPYWHDGTFVPYRPAAIRDPRFYQQQSTAWHGSLPPSQFAQHASPWPQPVPSNGHLAHPSNFNSLGAAAGYPTPFGRASTVGGHQQYHDHQSPRSFYPSELLSGFPASTGANHVPQAYLITGAQDISNEFQPSSPNGKQRDRTFAWALQQYRDLLAFIHHTRRQQQAARHVTGQAQIPHKPSFYPKPPLLTSSNSSLGITRRNTGPSVKQAVEQRFRRSSDPTRNQENREVNAADEDEDTPTPKARSPSKWSPSGVYSLDSEYPRRASAGQDPDPAPSGWQEALQQPDNYRTLRRSTGPTVSPIVSPLPQDDSPSSRAAVALQQITRLCQEADWDWIDGMHLGGCLAYGLGRYQQAQRWYNKVLERDPKHLEALSNLAATLLALGRRQEAEQHWSKVVRVAPSHFEAVEHLVGLLCNDNRSREAIKIIEYVERSLRQPKYTNLLKSSDRMSESSSSNASRSPAVSDLSDKMSCDFDAEADAPIQDVGSAEPGFGSSGFAIPGSDNGRILALIHAKGNMLYGTGDNGGAARAFEDAVLIAAGRNFDTIQALVDHILAVVVTELWRHPQYPGSKAASNEPILLAPEQALATAKLCFPLFGDLPGLHHVLGGPQSTPRKAVVSTTSNSLLSLAKIFQDGMSNSSRSIGVVPLANGVRDILALYYLSLALQPSPSTANNVGILLASVQQAAPAHQVHLKLEVPGVVPGSGIALALQYYNYGLQLDQHHAHLYTNLGSLLKDIGQLDAAITMYERAVKCDGKFDIALANLANAVKDKGRISDAIQYYKRAVDVSPDFAEAVCGLANALNSVCAWQSRGGIAEDGGKRDRWHVDQAGGLLDATQPGAINSGWIKRVVDIVEKQLVDGKTWGRGTLGPTLLEAMVRQILINDGSAYDQKLRDEALLATLQTWSGKNWEGARITRLVERATRRIGWQWYRDLYVRKRQRPPASYNRPQLPVNLPIPSAPTVLPFHTFTAPMSAEQIRLISQRNGLRISVCTLRAPWLPKQVYPPPQPPSPYLRVGYISSDFNNHPLAHLMQSVFGLHDRTRVKAYCYATTASDQSIHRQQIEREAPAFHDASSWSAERLVSQIVSDGIHILVNLNGYTRGARNEVFAARPAPIQMSFMGFAGTLGAEWCDYLLADETAVPPETLRPWRRNVDLEDQLVDDNNSDDRAEWVYGENIIYCRDTFFCCDHRQSAPDAAQKNVTWDEEQHLRWTMRKELFPQLPDDKIIFGNFNQLYKIEPTTFRSWLRILARVPNAVLWLLRFPDLGESHLLRTARAWATPDVARRIIFTDVAPKHLHISRACVCDLVLDTPECNAHTTAADVLWSGTPLLTLPRYPYKMCSRMAASILKGALPKSPQGARAATELIATGEQDYEEKAVALGRALVYPQGCRGRGQGRVVELRKMLYQSRWSSALFDTRRWTRDLEDAYEEAWRRWVVGEGGDIWLERMPRKG